MDGEMLSVWERFLVAEIFFFFPVSVGQSRTTPLNSVTVWRLETQWPDLAVGLAISPQNGTIKILRRSEIKNLPGELGGHAPRPPLMVAVGLKRSLAFKFRNFSSYPSLSCTQAMWEEENIAWYPLFTRKIYPMKLLGIIHHYPQTVNLLHYTNLSISDDFSCLKYVLCGNDD